MAKVARVLITIACPKNRLGRRKESDHFPYACRDGLYVILKRRKEMTVDFRSGLPNHFKQINRVEPLLFCPLLDCLERSRLAARRAFAMKAKFRHKFCVRNIRHVASEKLKKWSIIKGG